MTNVPFFTQEAILNLRVDLVQPLLGALGLSPVPRSEIDDRYVDAILPRSRWQGRTGRAFAVIRDTIAKMNMVAIARVVLTRREHIIALEARGRGLLGLTLIPTKFATNSRISKTFPI